MSYSFLSWLWSATQTGSDTIGIACGTLETNGVCLAWFFSWNRERWSVGQRKGKNPPHFPLAFVPARLRRMYAGWSGNAFYPDSPNDNEMSWPPPHLTQMVYPTPPQEEQSDRPWRWWRIEFFPWRVEDNFNRDSSRGNPAEFQRGFSIHFVAWELRRSERKHPTSNKEESNKDDSSLQNIDHWRRSWEDSRRWDHDGDPTIVQWISIDSFYWGCQDEELNSSFLVHLSGAREKMVCRD